MVKLLIYGDILIRVTYVTVKNIYIVLIKKKYSNT